jgi:hypothetical protein
MRVGALGASDLLSADVTRRELARGAAPASSVTLAITNGGHSARIAAHATLART